MSNDLEYKEKYEKYKLKYINLKNIIQEGSAKGDDDDSPKGETIGEGDSDEDFSEDFGDDDFGEEDFGEEDFSDDNSSKGETIGQIPANIQQPLANIQQPVSVITWTPFLDANGKTYYHPSDNSPSFYLEQMPDTWKDASGTILNKAVLISQQKIQELQQQLKDQEKQGQQLNLQLQNQEKQLLETQQESPPTSPPGSPSTSPPGSPSTTKSTFFSGIKNLANNAYTGVQEAWARRQERIAKANAAKLETENKQRKLKETEDATKQLLADAKQAEAAAILAAAERAKTEAVKTEAVKTEQRKTKATNSQKQIRWAMKMRVIKGKLRVYFKPDNGGKPVWYHKMPNTWIDPKRKPVKKRNGLKDFLINNKESVLNLVLKDVKLFEFLPKKLIGDLFKSLPEKLRGDYYIALAAVKQNGMLLEFVPKLDNRNHEKDIVLAAVKENGFALQFAGKLQDDSSIVQEAFDRENRNRKVLNYASNRVYNKYYR